MFCPLLSCVCSSYLLLKCLLNATSAKLCAKALLARSVHYTHIQYLYNFRNYISVINFVDDRCNWLRHLIATQESKRVAGSTPDDGTYFKRLQER